LILRMVRGRVLPGRHEALRAGLVASFSQVRELPGLLQAYVALRASPDGNEFAVISTWTTPDATMAAFGPEVNRVATVPGVSEHLDFRTVEHFEVDESVVVHADVPPAVARIAIGAIELGGDVEVQQELRRRIPELGKEVVEAAVGRRIRDRMVEVAFVTFWSDRPAGGCPLEEPVFPDVAERYSSYSIEVYDEVFRA
jgi:heme-degrading monooxygenase HmoA